MRNRNNRRILGGEGDRAPFGDESKAVEHDFLIHDRRAVELPEIEVHARLIGARNVGAGVRPREDHGGRRLVVGSTSPAAELNSIVEPPECMAGQLAVAHRRRKSDQVAGVVVRLRDELDRILCRIPPPAELDVDFPQDFRGRATGAILVDGDVGGYRISGLVDLTHSHYTAEFDARRESLDRIDYQLAALRGQGSITDNLPLAVDVRLKDPLRVRNSKAQLDVTGTVTVNGMLAQPTATGQVSLIEGGRITIRRARVRAQEGRAELNGYPAGVPDVDFEGLTQVGGVTMSLRAQGSMNDLALDIRSPNRPDLSQTDLVAASHRPDLLGGGGRGGRDPGRGARRRPRRRAAEPRRRRPADRRLERRVDAARRGGPHPALPDRHARRPGLRRVLLDPPRRHGAALGRAVGPPRRPVHLPRDPGLRGGAGRRGDRPGPVSNIFPGRERSHAAAASPLSKLDSLRFEGALPLPEEELRRAARLRIGRRYDPLRLAQAADRVRAKLVEAGFRAAWVDAEGARGPGPQGPRGARAERGGGAEDRDLLGRRRPRPERPPEGSRRGPPFASPEAAAATLARTARIELQAARHFEAKVDHEVRVTDAETAVVLSVVQGPRGTGVDVEFEGNRQLTGEQLAPHAAEAGVAGVLRRARSPGAPGGRRPGRLRRPRSPARARRARAHPLRRGERTALRDHSRPRGRVLARRRADAFRTACPRSRRADRR